VPVTEFHEKETEVPDNVEPGVGLAITAGLTRPMVVLSVAVAVVDPPLETVTLFTCGDVALAATFTVTVMGG
jgi:hypothetical protein